MYWHGECLFTSLRARAGEQYSFGVWVSENEFVLGVGEPYPVITKFSLCLVCYLHSLALLFLVVLVLVKLLMDSD